jgi:hypothetical protein
MFRIYYDASDVETEVENMVSTAACTPASTKMVDYILITQK